MFNSISLIRLRIKQIQLIDCMIYKLRNKAVLHLMPMSIMEGMWNKMDDMSMDEIADIKKLISKHDD